MSTFNYLGRVRYPIPEQALETLVSKSSPYWLVREDDAYTEGLGLCPLTTEEVLVIFSYVRDWHTDYDNETYATLLVLQSDGHIVQSRESSDCNDRVLVPGDVLRLRVDKEHRLISDKEKPELFII